MYTLTFYLTRLTAIVPVSAAGNKQGSYSMASLYQVSAFEYKVQLNFNPYNRYYATRSAKEHVSRCLADVTGRPD